MQRIADNMKNLATSYKKLSVQNVQNEYKEENTEISPYLQRKRKGSQKRTITEQYSRTSNSGLKPTSI